MTGNLTSSCPPLSGWYAVNVTGVAGALFATQPLPLAGNTEGPEEDNGESNDDECNDNDDDGNNDVEEDGNNGDGDVDSFFGDSFFDQQALIRRILDKTYDQSGIYYYALINKDS